MTRGPAGSLRAMREAFSAEYRYMGVWMSAEYHTGTLPSSFQ